MAARSPEFRKYQAQLGRLAEEAFPKAIAETLSSVAGFAHVNQARVLRSEFTLRNQYTERSLRFYKASPKSTISKINAVVGSISEYLPMHEAGGQRKPKQGSKVSVATLKARGGRASSVVRKKYRAGSLGPGQFVGRPRGNPARASGVYERYNRNRKIRMIRNLENTSVQIKPSHWHTLAVKPYNKQAVIESEFIRQAKLALSAVGAT